MGGGMSSTSKAIALSNNARFTLIAIFCSLFILLSLLHAAEIAITTLYPWKVREFAEEEGEGSPFTTLNSDITRVLTTILVTSTTASIYATTIFARLASSCFGKAGEKYAALSLTILTLFFVELLPKSVGVSNAELVARKMVPPINVMAGVVAPLGIFLTALAKRTLKLFGLKPGEIEDVSEEELRLIVSGARDSGSIESTEGEMIQGVLDLQDQKIREIMRPRVEIIAIPKEMSVANVLGVIRESGYSRIPVYDGEIDNIVGVVMAKDLIDFFVGGMAVESGRLDKIKMDRLAFEQREMEREMEGEEARNSPPTYTDTLLSKDPVTVPTPNTFGFGGTGGSAGTEVVVKALTGAEIASRMTSPINEVTGLIGETYFVPESMIVWNVLQEMKKRRVHLAIVVDEYGGTEGLVSLEDIVEQVVGEIYDEDDDEEEGLAEDAIFLQEDGRFVIRGDGDLPDVLTALSLEVEEEVLKEYGTLSGFLVFSAGEIPKPGDIILVDKWQFEIIHADERRILEVEVEKMEDEEGGKKRKGRQEGGEEEEEEGLDGEYPGGDDIVDEQGRVLVEKVEKVAESSVEKMGWKSNSEVEVGGSDKK
ncbi:hypothetical protein TL16_g06304 [Triparma laevis f. inornata]|uniref:Uncharacterized protein n=1 Tax=Triparma laevis f. inornata TaxID=1714386 RepID=A0A9W7AMK7_9STRA|nr:hypothetical protein TL16_g06304 [Triparma laevis f. inornata]